MEVSRNVQPFHIYMIPTISAVEKVYKIFMDTEGNHIIPEQVFHDRVHDLITKAILKINSLLKHGKITSVLNSWFKSCDPKDWFKKIIFNK